MNAAALFLTGAGTGLLAGGTTCAAVQLGLLAGAVRDAPRPIAPVATFLSGKLAAHALLGALLGLAGAAVQPSAQARAILLTAAALLLTTFALDLLGIPPAQRLLRRFPTPCHPPPPGTSDMTRSATDSPAPSANGMTSTAADLAARGSSMAGAAADAAARGRRGTAADPAAAGVCGMGGAGADVRGGSGVGRAGWLGVATVLVPCGLTLSAELLAVTSRSVVGGVAVMAGFVLGTAPVFGVLGMVLGHALEVLRGRLTALIGVGLLVVAGWTMLSGLRLGGWLPETSPTASAAVNARFVTVDATGTQVVTIWAVRGGYRPAVLSGRAGIRTVLVLRTDHDQDCTRDFVIPSRGVERVLPATGTLRIDLGVSRAGRMRFTCALGHYFGQVTFR